MNTGSYSFADEATKKGVESFISLHDPISAYILYVIEKEDVRDTPYKDGKDLQGNQLWAVGAGDNGTLEYIEKKYRITYDSKTDTWSDTITNKQAVNALYDNIEEARDFAENELQIHSSINPEVASAIKVLAIDLYINWGARVKTSDFAKDVAAGKINEALVNAREITLVPYKKGSHYDDLDENGNRKFIKYTGLVTKAVKVSESGLEGRRDTLINVIHDERTKSGEVGYIMTPDSITKAVELKRDLRYDSKLDNDISVDEAVKRIKEKEEKQGVPASTNEQEVKNSIHNSIQNSSVQGDSVASSEIATVDTNTDGITPVTPTQYTPTELASLVNAGVLGSNPSYNVVFKNAKQVSLSMDISSDNYNMANQVATISVVPANVSTAATTTGTSYIFANALAGTRNPHVNVDPLILDLDGDGIELLLFGEKETYFDTDNDGYQERTGWVGKDDGILVHDLSGNGKIDDITETISEYYKAPKGGGSLGGPASNPFKSGFDALKTLDNNGNGVINSADSVWSSLRVWQDINGDGISHSTGTNPVSELKTLASLRITEIKLANKADGTFISGNEARANGSYTMNGTSKTVSSVNFLSNTFGLVESSNPSGSNLAGKTYKVEEVNSSIYTTYAASNGGESVDLTTTTYRGYNNIIGGTGDDTLKGNSQNNWLVGNTGKDAMDAGDGDDYVVADAADITSDQSGLKGGSGYDTIQFVGRMEGAWSWKPYRSCFGWQSPSRLGGLRVAQCCKNAHFGEKLCFFTKNLVPGVDAQLRFRVRTYKDVVKMLDT